MSFNNSKSRMLGTDQFRHGEPVREVQKRDAFLDGATPKGLEVFQLTTNPGMASHHIYPESQMFTPDSKCFVFHRMSVEGLGLGDFWLCDIGDDFRLTQVTQEEGAKGVSVSPDGKWLYYIVDRTLLPEAEFELKRLSLKDFTRSTIIKHGGAIPGTSYVPSRLYPLTSISSDGRRLCTCAFLGDGKTDNAPWGLLVFDLDSSSVKLVFEGPSFLNMHPQYCRSQDPLLKRDILIQHNHGSLCDRSGKMTKNVGDGGVDLHVIRDDGTNWRDVPLGRDGVDFCTGHQQWRGRTGNVFSAMHHLGSGVADGHVEHIFEAVPIVTDEKHSHSGATIPGAKYTNLTRNIDEARFDHFSGDLTGRQLVLRNERKCDNPNNALEFFTATVLPGENPAVEIQHLLNPRSNTGNEAFSRLQSNKPRPFFSPDARMVLFHSDFDGGLSQIYLAKLSPP